MSRVRDAVWVAAAVGVGEVEDHRVPDAIQLLAKPWCRTRSPGRKRQGLGDSALELEAEKVAFSPEVGKTGGPGRTVVGGHDQSKAGRSERQA